MKINLINSINALITNFSSNFEFSKKRSLQNPQLHRKEPKWRKVAHQSHRKRTSSNIQRWSTVLVPHSLVSHYKQNWSQRSSRSMGWRDWKEIIVRKLHFKHQLKDRKSRATNHPTFGPLQASLYRSKRRRSGATDWNQRQTSRGEHLRDNLRCNQ